MHLARLVWCMFPIHSIFTSLIKSTSICGDSGVVNAALNPTIPQVYKFNFALCTILKKVVAPFDRSISSSFSSAGAAAAASWIVANKCMLAVVKTCVANTIRAFRSPEVVPHLIHVSTHSSP